MGNWVHTPNVLVFKMYLDALYIFHKFLKIQEELR